MDEKAATSVVWREAFAIIRKYPLATIAPAAVLGALAEAPAYLIEGRPVLDNALTYLTAAVAYYLYLAYAEEIAAEYQRGAAHITLRGMLRELRQAMPFVLRVLAAGLITLSIASVATGLLVIPGAWLYTRWSLSIPAIRSEDLGPVAALKRSNELVRGRFWFVFGTATLAFFLEEALIHAGALVGYLVSGSHTWGEWVGGSIIASLVIPLAALTTSVAYSSVARPAESTEGA